MSRRSWIELLILASMWGASYLFIKVALDDVSPAWVVFARTALAALVLLPFALGQRALGGLRGLAAPILLLAAVQVAGPFLLISEGERHISSSLAGILVATAPIFTFLLAIRIDQDERAEGVGILGVALGIAGVVLLLGVDTGGGTMALVGGLMVVVASLGYALGGFYLKRRIHEPQPIAIVAATMGASALMTAPLAAISLPPDIPALDTFGALAALGAFGTGVAFVLFYGLIARIGPSKAALVAYIAPVFAIFYGVALLDESFTLATLFGMVLILGGSWLAAEGRLPWQSKREPAAVLAEARAKVPA